MSTPKETPKKAPRQGIPVEKILVALGIFGFVGLVFLGVRTLTERVKLDSVPLAGEWQAIRNPWRIEFRPDNTVVSANGPSQPGAAQAQAVGKGSYKVDFFGTLWVTLDNGRVFTSVLVPQMPNRFDLIESATESVTVFERVSPPKPNPPASSE